MPIKRFERWLTEEKIDFKYPDNLRWYANPKTTKNSIFSHATIKLVSGTTVLKSSLKKSTAEFKAIGNLLGFYLPTWVEQINSGKVMLYQDASTKILLQQLIAGNIDGINIEPSVISHYLKVLGKPADTIAIDRRFTYQVHDFHLSTIKHPKIIREFNDFLHNNKALLEQLNKK